MAYYYVKNGGTATGDAGRATSARTGSFAAMGASAYYDSLISALGASTAPADGDTIYFSDLHNKDYAASTTFTLPSSVNLVSVSDTACNSYSSGAIEQTATGNTDLTFIVTSGKTIKVYGLTFKADDDLACSAANTTILFYDGGGLEVTGTASGENITFTGDGSFYGFYNATVKFAGSSGDINFGNATMMEFVESTIDFNSTTPPQLFVATSNGGIVCKMRDCDLTASTAGSTNFLDALSFPDDYVNIELIRCKLPSGLSFNDCAARNQVIDLYSCDTTGDGYHYFEHKRREGRAIENTTVYRSGGATYDGTNGFSFEFQPSSVVEPYTDPLRIKIAELELDLTSANTLTFHLGFIHSTTVPTLNNDDIWIEIEQNDATDNALGLVKDTKPTDILTTPSALTASTETWTGLTGTDTDKRQIAVTTTAVTGMTNGQVTAYLCVAYYDANLEVYCCSSPVVT